MNMINKYLTRSLVASILLLFVATSCRDDNRADIEQSIQEVSVNKDLSKGEAKWYFGITVEGEGVFRATQTDFVEDPNAGNGGMADFSQGKEGIRFTIEEGDDIYVYAQGKNADNSSNIYYCGNTSVSSVKSLAEYNDAGYLLDTPNYKRKGMQIGFTLPHFDVANVVDKLIFTTQPLQNLGDGNWGYKSSGHFMALERANGDNPLHSIKLPLVAETTMQSLVDASAGGNACVINPLKFKQVACIIKTHIINAMDMRSEHITNLPSNWDLPRELLKTGFHLRVSDTRNSQLTQLGANFTSVSSSSSVYSAIKIFKAKNAQGTFPTGQSYEYNLNDDDYIYSGDYKAMGMIFFPPAEDRVNAGQEEDWKTEKNISHIGVMPTNKAVYKYGDIAENPDLGYHAFMVIKDKLRGHLRGHFLELPYLVNYVDFARVPGSPGLMPRFDWYKGLIISSQKSLGEVDRNNLDNYKVTFNKLLLSDDLATDAFRGRYTYGPGNHEPYMYNAYELEWRLIWSNSVWKDHRFISVNASAESEDQMQSKSELLALNGNLNNNQSRKMTKSPNRYLFMMGNFKEINLNDHAISKLIIIAPEIEALQFKACSYGFASQDAQKDWKELIDGLPFLPSAGQIDVVISQHDDPYDKKNVRPIRDLVALAYRKGYNLVHRTSAGGLITCYEGGIGYN